MTLQRNTEAAKHFETLFEQLPDPVVEFEQDEDGEPVIINANSAFRDTFAPDESVTDYPLNELIVPADYRDEAATFDQRTAHGEVNKAIVERAASDGRRKFLYRGVSADEDRGFAIYSDVTERLNQERHLDVLQRVLRHNLRNDLTVIDGQLKQALDVIDDEDAHDALETIQERVDGLIQLCSEAQTIRKVIGESASLERTELTDTLTPVVENCKQRFPHAAITVDCPDGLAVIADDRLEIVVESLIDNAVRHNTASTPTVTVSAIADEDTVELAVADNGPGIPTSEQRVIAGEIEVSPLSHGSGLGLWLVKWLTESYGGSLEIDTPGDGGSIVRLRLARPSDE
jgi:signal transduction histidine kinase